MAPGTVVPNDRALERQDAYFRLMDSDRDGSISKAEVCQSEPGKHVARYVIDENQDQRDSAEEVNACVSVMFLGRELLQTIIHARKRSDANQSQRFGSNRRDRKDVRRTTKP